MTNDLLSLFTDHLQTLAQRIDHALANCGADGVAIYSGQPPMLFLDDQPYPFKVNPHFKAWAPMLDAPHSWIVHRHGTRPLLVLLQPDDYWHKPPSLPADRWIDAFEVISIREPQHARQYVASRQHAFIGEWQSAFEDWGFASVNLPALLNPLHFQRAAKTPYEVECMRRANLRGARGHQAAEAAFRAGGSEYEINHEYLRGTGLTQEEMPYGNIVALNAHGAVLHYQYLERTAPGASERLSLLIDAGAQFRGYASDITRTYAFHPGDFSALIAAVDDVQLTLCDQVRPGMDYVDIHLNAHQAIAKLLSEADVISLSPEDAVDSGLSSVFFPHGIGHLLGLQVHDVAGFMSDASGTQRAAPEAHPFLRLTRTLAPGFIVTIEPGIYFIDKLLKEAQAGPHRDHINWRMVERYRPYGGIRIEDNVLCTSAAPENLTRAAFAELSI